MNLGFRHKLGIGFGLAFSLYALMGFCTYKGLTSYMEADKLRLHTFQVQNTLESLLSQLQDTEIGQRGYLLTANPSYLAPYHLALGKIQSNLRLLRKLTVDLPVQQQRIVKLEALTNDKLAELKLTIHFRQKQGLDSALHVVRSDHGLMTMNQLRAVIAEMKNTETGLLEERERRAKQGAKNVFLFLFLSGFFSSILLISLYILINREVSRRENAEKGLAHINEKLEYKVAQRTAQLERSNRELEQFAAIASHDLQEPLRKVMMFSQMIAEKSSEETRDYAVRMQNAVARMQELIHDLLILSRVNRKGEPFHEVDLNEALRNTLGDLEVSIKERNAVISTGPLGMIEADQRQIEQLLANLVSNALKFHKPDMPPRIKIHGQIKDDGMYELIVEDEGIGFGNEYRERIFEPFERLHGRDPSYPGTGMGLAICRKIVERHKGRIVAYGVPNHGATFKMDLPLRHPA